MVISQIRVDLLFFAHEDFLFEIKKRDCQALSGEETTTKYTEETALISLYTYDFFTSVNAYFHF